MFHRCHLHLSSPPRQLSPRPAPAFPGQTSERPFHVLSQVSKRGRPQATLLSPWPSPSSRIKQQLPLLWGPESLKCTPPLPAPTLLLPCLGWVEVSLLPGPRPPTSPSSAWCVPHLRVKFYVLSGFGASVQSSWPSAHFQDHLSLHMDSHFFSRTLWQSSPSFLGLCCMSLSDPKQLVIVLLHLSSPPPKQIFY